MAKELIFKMQGKEYGLEPVKLDRKKLYGWTEKTALDDNGDECAIVSIDETGTIIIPKGGTGSGIIDSGGNWLDKSSLITVDSEGNPAEKVVSSFNAPIDLAETVSLNEFLEHSITSIYSLQGEENCPELINAIKASKGIYYFYFNYRDSFEPSPAFLILKDEELFVLVGKKNIFEFIELENAGFLEEEEIETEDEDELDFSMM